MATGTLGAARPVGTGRKLVLEGIGIGPLAEACKCCHVLAYQSELQFPSEGWLLHMVRTASGCMAGSTHIERTLGVTMPELGKQLRWPYRWTHHAGRAPPWLLENQYTGDREGFHQISRG